MKTIERLALRFVEAIDEGHEELTSAEAAAGIIPMLQEYGDECAAQMRQACANAVRELTEVSRWELSFAALRKAEEVALATPIPVESDEHA